MFRLLKTCFVISSVALIKNISRMARKGDIRHLLKMTGNFILPRTTHFRLYYVWGVILPPGINIQNTRRFCETRRSQAIHCSIVESREMRRDGCPNVWLLASSHKWASSVKSLSVSHQQSRYFDFQSDQDYQTLDVSGLKIIIFSES